MQTVEGAVQTAEVLQTSAVEERGARRPSSK